MKEIMVRGNYFPVDPENWDDNPVIAEEVLLDETKEKTYYCYRLWTLAGGMDERFFRVPVYDYLCSNYKDEEIRTAYQLLSDRFEITKSDNILLYEHLKHLSDKVLVPWIGQVAKENGLIDEEDEIDTLL